MRGAKEVVRDVKEGAGRIEFRVYKVVSIFVL